MSDALRSLLDLARRHAVKQRIQQAAVVGSAIAGVATLAITPLVGFPRSGWTLLAIPLAAGVARYRAAPPRVALARRLDDHFATGDLLATALGVDDDAIGRAIVAQADALAARLATSDVAFDRETMRRRLAIAGLAVAASLTLSAVLSSPARSTAAERRASVAQRDSADSGDDRAVGDRSQAAPNRSPRVGEAESADASQMNTASDAAAHDAGRAAAHGTGAARTNATIAAPPARSGRAAARADSAPATGDGDAASGAPSAVVANGTAGRIAIDVATSSIATPTSIARDAIAAGRVPAASRSLVRAFFDAGDPTR